VPQPRAATPGDNLSYVRDGYALFWFRGHRKGGWPVVKDCGLPTQGLSLYSLLDNGTIVSIAAGEQLAVAWGWRQGDQILEAAVTRDHAAVRCAARSAIVANDEGLRLRGGAAWVG
jgi:hypothetical protein